MAESGHMLKELERQWAKMKADAEATGVDLGDLEWEGVEPWQLPSQPERPIRSTDETGLWRRAAWALTCPETRR